MYIHACNIVTDSEAETGEEETTEKTAGSSGGAGFMDNIMGIEELEPASAAEEPSTTNSNHLIQVKRYVYVHVKI